MKGGFSVIKGPLKDNAGNEVVAAGARPMSRRRSSSKA